MKHEIRKKALCARDENHDPVDKSGAIAKRLFQQPEYQSAKSVLLYFSIGSEVDTCKIIRDALKTKKVFLPFVEGGEMGYAQIQSMEGLEPGKYGIMEPLDKEPSSAGLDLVVVPGIAFDESGHRVGYGGGYYDRFLPAANAFTIGLAYDAQVIEDIPAEGHDCPVKKIVTETRVITC
ncbi:MAG: 5-formyltetrahydrofolate cyclo-ligase [Candidatus Diapherotrites archaeon]|nr:5-formyltetrahydrofolate cyclo-ligase [Candidatus Diapherotrites archaeon]